MNVAYSGCDSERYHAVIHHTTDLVECCVTRNTECVETSESWLWSWSLSHILLSEHVWCHGSSSQISQP